MFLFFLPSRLDLRKNFFDLYDYGRWNMFSCRRVTLCFLSLFLSMLDGGWMALEALQLAPHKLIPRFMDGFL
jgi:hypothetical protein